MRWWLEFPLWEWVLVPLVLWVLFSLSFFRAVVASPSLLLLGGVALPPFSGRAVFLPPPLGGAVFSLSLLVGGCCFSPPSPFVRVSLPGAVLPFCFADVELSKM